MERRALAPAKLTLKAAATTTITARATTNQMGLCLMNRVIPRSLDSPLDITFQLVPP